MTIFLFMLQLIATIICIFTSIWIIFNRNDIYKKRNENNLDNNHNYFMDIYINIK